jgi:spore maturation protein CgeB
MVRQMMLGLRGAGAEVYEYNTDLYPEALDCEGRPYDRGTFGPVWLRWEALQPRIAEFGPDLIVCNAGGLSFRPEVAGALRQGTMLLGIALSDPDVFPPATSRIAKNFDLFLTNAGSMIPRYREIGATVDVLPLATNEEFFHPVPPRVEQACEVLVVGRANPDRVEPVRHLHQHFKLHLYGEGWEPHGLPSRGLLYGEDLLSALSSAQISIIFLYTPGGHAIGKVALFDFIAGGALMATNYLTEIERYFEYDREIIGFSSIEELIRKVQFYIAHPADARAVREAGRKRVISDHVWRKAWPAILENLRDVRASRC